MNIGYVCTNYNNSLFSIQAVKTLHSNSHHKYFVVVVDNKSDIEHLKQLESLARDFPSVHIIFNKNNVGYFRGLNIGISFIRKNYPEVDWMIVGNNDLEFPYVFSDKLASNSVRWREHPVISPDIITINGEHQNPHVIHGISKVRELVYDAYYSNYCLGILIYKFSMIFSFLFDRRDEDFWQIAQSIHQGHGSCYLLGPRFFEQFEELWAPTFIMFEEFFLSKQLDDVGQKVFYDPAIQVVHHWHASLNTLPGRQRWNFAREAFREYRKFVNFKVLRK